MIGLFTHRSFFGATGSPRNGPDRTEQSPQSGGHVGAVV